jgi:hypothetical protein
MLLMLMLMAWRCPPICGIQGEVIIEEEEADWWGDDAHNPHAFVDTHCSICLV